MIKTDDESNNLSLSRTNLGKKSDWNGNRADKYTTTPIEWLITSQQDTIDMEPEMRASLESVVFALSNNLLRYVGT